MPRSCCSSALLIGAGRIGWLPADLFFRLDPLAGIAGMIAARQIVPALLIGAAVTLVATLLLGRVWCGWLCPLGTVLDVTPARRKKRYEPDPTPRLRSVKYVLLALILVAALLGNLTFLILDPITLLYRTATTALWPALVALISGVETVLYRLPFLQGAIDRFEGAFRGVILPLEQPAYGMGVLLLLIFAGILALNAIRDRFWCRYLCPLGALLGLVSKVAWLRREVGDVCTECQRCARACPVGTIDPARQFASDPAECTVCLDCVPVCAKAGQGFTGHYRPAPRQAYDPSRRQFIASAGAAVVAVGLFAAEPAAVRAGPRLIRPPGAQGPEFLRVHPLRHLSEGLPHVGPPAEPGAGRVVGAVDAGARPAAGVLRLQLQRLRRRLPDRRDPAPGSGGQAAGGDRPRVHRPGSLSALGRQPQLPGVRGDVPGARKGHHPGGCDGDGAHGRRRSMSGALSWCATAASAAASARTAAR